MSDPILDRLERIEQALSKADSERPLNFTEAANFLSCSKSYLYKLTHRRQVPCFKPLGKRLFFKRADLQSFLFRNPVKTAEAIDRQAANRVAFGKGGAA